MNQVKNNENNELEQDMLKRLKKEIYEREKDNYKKGSNINDKTMIEVIKNLIESEVKQYENKKFKN